ncbi:MAG TPA: TonB-dependent receptor plug domain-containing protein, partial [Chitinophagaceae bacterium]
MRKIRLLLVLALLCSIQGLRAQTQVSGRITNAADGSPLEGVTISVKNSNISTVTDRNGNFSLSAPANSMLVFSYVGFVTIERPAASVMNIGLSTGSDALTEVVVVGYGTAIKKDLTGNIATVKGADVQNLPVANFNQALQGRAAGVFVEANNGKVGEGVKVRIRGAGSISASNEPLYVVDGIPINTNELSGNALADLNFNDVESFQILKDASA